jgi:hypothetical protein
MLDAPAPFDTGQLYLFEKLLIDELKGAGIVVDQSHDAFVSRRSRILLYKTGRIEF